MKGEEGILRIKKKEKRRRKEKGKLFSFFFLFFEANVHRIVPPGDVKQLMEFVKQFIEEEEIVVSILGIFGCVCKFDCRTFRYSIFHFFFFVFSFLC